MNIELQNSNYHSVKVRFDLDQQQREYFLQQQMKTIQEELWFFARRRNDAAKIQV
jgi:ATP-dependent Lon protease